MFDFSTALLIIALLFGLVFMGVHVVVALGIASAVGIYMVTGKLRIVEATMASTAAEALRDFTFAVIPLFMLMGEFIGRSGAIGDIYVAINRGLRRIPARLAIATVLGNTVFSFVTGVSIASAAAFSRISYPEMKKHGYNPGFALGAIAGSSCLGMLIPPSVLMIVWGILTEQSIGRLFLAGVLPGALLASMFILYILATAYLRPEKVGAGRDQFPAVSEAADNPGNAVSSTSTEVGVFTSFAGVGGIIAAVLGGIWWGVFTPTEGAGAGAALALILAFFKGMNLRGFINAVYSVGKTAAPIMVLLLTAALYSRTLAMTGITSAIRSFFIESGLQPWSVLAIIVMIWFVLGMIIDSISIMLLTVPIVEPVAMSFGFDQLSFAITGIIAIEAGLLTPPFGLLVYTVKAAIQDDDVGVQHIFMASIPYWAIMLLAVLLVVAFPGIANFLPDSLM
ncbi:TRAP transporter large permease [Candidatus Halocynthiibacter alkanivorans]|uniref:TRAP transporter large permease n=1 Tax=Candidatus Halocynthiibacter alkanivorans TaxID=2267619 RepID=UPI001F1C0154|nr:TRAP transporter large permease subunit [Candidatus Halocynthiibacter alkanivorans]